jgi:hypothetical protein
MILTTQAEGSSIEHEMAEQRVCQPLAKKANHVGGYHIVKNTTIVVLRRDVIIISKSWMKTYKANRHDNAHSKETWELLTCH